MSTPPPSDSPASGPNGRGSHALERLRERVEAAAAEIERLRSENAALAERVQVLAAHDAARGDGTGLPAIAIEGDPDDLRKKVEGFIETIDRMLAEPTAGSGSGEDAASESAS